MLPGKVQIFNLTLTNGSTEYSQALPNYAQKIMVRCRTAFDLQVAFTSGQSNGTYFTIPAGQTYWDDSVNCVLILYAQSATAGVVVEIVAWSGNSPN